ncbi:MAG: amidohydrolase family protein [Phycisphaerales bacterium JB065]
MIVQGLLLTDPAQPPQLGWIRTERPSEADPGRIAEIGYGELPSDLGPPDFGGRDRIICPAFTDAHFHVPQVESVGADGLHLLEWLDRVIFPAEAWWARGGAMASARTAARRLIREGTAGFAGYLTSHAEASRDVAMYFANKTPMRFHLGRSAMDRHAPDDLTAEDRSRVKQSPIPSPLLPVLGVYAKQNRRFISANPRFAVSCSDELLAEIGWAVAERENAGERIIVQTHLAETRPECALIAELFPDAPHYTAVYDQAGLLRPGALLAHGIYLSDDELTLIRERDATIVHCPTANLFLQSGLFDWTRTAHDHGVRVLLGSDIAGGPDVAMPRVGRAMIETAKALKLTRRGADADRIRVPSPVEVWTLITAGNAQIFEQKDHADRFGVLEEGAHADLLVLRVPDAWRDEHLIGRLIYSWSSRLIESRIFNGQFVDPQNIERQTGGRAC